MIKLTEIFSVCQTKILLWEIGNINTGKGLNHPIRILLDSFLSCQQEEQAMTWWIHHLYSNNYGLVIDIHSTWNHSHSIVDGGFDVMSRVTRFTPRTLLQIFRATSSRNLCSKQYPEFQNCMRKNENFRILYLRRGEGEGGKRLIPGFFSHTTMVNKTKENAIFLDIKKLVTCNTYSDM